MRKYMRMFYTIALLLPLSHAAWAVTVDYRIELKANFRDSDSNTFPHAALPATPFQTVDSGSHPDLSNVAIFAKAQLSENWRLSAKIDAIDLYERNPSSGDKKVDLDVFHLRYGTKHGNGLLPETTSFYGQIGKFSKFERQEDRHLESYGLVSTAFNRLEDSGLEFGVDFSSGFYGKLSYTTGSPVFIRDPNALAGDNGTRDPEVETGIVILYDAEVEDFNLSKNPELGIGAGWRWVSKDGYTRFNVLAHYNKRELADTTDLKGTFYGGDLDILELEPHEFTAAGLSATAGLPISNNDKTEQGVTVWLYADNLALFGQYVDQELAGLNRDGWELELSYKIPKVLGLKSITPVVRYSTLSPDFSADKLYPAVSVTWDWDKIDYGVNVDFNDHIRLTIERSDNNFIRAGNTESNNETLATLRFIYDF